MAAWLREAGVELVVLRGLHAAAHARLPRAFPQRGDQRPPVAAARVPGPGAIAEAFDYGAKVTGVTVHFVDEGVDTGAIILQRALEIGDAADADALHDRLRPLEHALLPEAVRLIAAGAVTFDRPTRAGPSSPGNSGPGGRVPLAGVRPGGETAGS
jgi:phosphoribosylglycinamide formyltransferase-1